MCKLSTPSSSLSSSKGSIKGWDITYMSCKCARDHRHDQKNTDTMDKINVFYSVGRKIKAL